MKLGYNKQSSQTLLTAQRTTFILNKFCLSALSRAVRKYKNFCIFLIAGKQYFWSENHIQSFTYYVMYFKVDFPFNLFSCSGNKLDTWCTLSVNKARSHFNGYVDYQHVTSLKKNFFCKTIRFTLCL
jgi:hypothetical protein